MANPQFSKPKILFFIILFIFAFGERVFFDFGPNVELVTTALILSSFYLGRKITFWLIFAIMLFSDLIIGNSNIYIFTWTGFLLPALSISYYVKTKKGKAKKAASGTFMGIVSNGFFFLWTNFGVWLLSGMYPKTVYGLTQSYINALPFLRNQLISTLIFVPLGFALTESIMSLGKKYQIENKLKFLLTFN